MTIESNNTVHAYVSGACTTQNKCGGWGIVLTREGKRKEVHEGARQTTQHRMVLTAAIKALTIIRKNNSEKPIVVSSSNQYLIDGMNKNLKSWKQGQWRKSNRTPVLHADLWQQLDELAQPLNVNWIKGKAGHIEIDKADHLAKAAKPKK